MYKQSELIESRKAQLAKNLTDHAWPVTPKTEQIKEWEARRLVTSRTDNEPPFTNKNKETKEH